MRMVIWFMDLLTSIDIRQFIYHGEGGKVGKVLYSHVEVEC